MKGRLSFAMGAFIEPDILIIDETLSAGDVFFAEKAIQRMKDIASKGRIVLVVSHWLETIVEMCDRCLWLDQGRLIMDGGPKQVAAPTWRESRRPMKQNSRANSRPVEPFGPRPDAGGLRPHSPTRG